MWTITDTQNREITIEQLQSDYPDLVAYDESGFDIDLDDGLTDSLADNGYFGREGRRILFWADEQSSENDPGSNAVASAEWTDA